MSCKGCAYAVLLSGAWCCDYLLMTGHCRPCPPGEGCTVRREGDLSKKGSAFMKRRVWDTEEARLLYEQKLPDAEIAERVGTTAAAVSFWHRGLRLPANPGRQPAAAEAAPKTEPPAPPLSPPPPPPNEAPAANQRSVCGGERRKEWSGRSPRRQAETERSGISSDEVPVELSVELDGHAFSLRAPSLAGAAWMLEYAGRLLEGLAGGKEDTRDA